MFLSFLLGSMMDGGRRGHSAVQRLVGGCVGLVDQCPEGSGPLLPSRRFLGHLFHLVLQVVEPGFALFGPISGRAGKVLEDGVPGIGELGPLGTETGTPNLVEKFTGLGLAEASLSAEGRVSLVEGGPGASSAFGKLVFDLLRGHVEPGLESVGR